MNNFDLYGKLHSYFIGYRVTKSIGLIIKLGVCDRLGNDLSIIKSVQELGKECGCSNIEGLYRVMRALTFEGIFKEVDKDKQLFQHTELSLYLVNDFIKQEGIMKCGIAFYKSFESLEDSVLCTSNNNSNSKSKPLGKDSFWEVLNENKSLQIEFNTGMTGLTSRQLDNLIEPGEFNKYETICDLGGNQGIFIKRILKENEFVKLGINFDQPSVINELLVNNIDEHDKRYKNIGGDFFKHVPESDCYLLKWILHDWDDNSCSAILNTISNSIKPNGKVYIIDFIFNEPNTSHEHNKYIAWSDVMLLHIFGGKERSRKEFELIFNKTPFKIESIKSPNKDFIQPIIILTLK